VRRLDFFRLASSRIALLYAGLFTVSAMILFAVIYQATAGYTARQMTEAIDSDLAGLVREYRLVGRDEVMGEIAIRLGAGHKTPRYYLLQSPGGRVVAGNIGPLLPNPGWVDLAVFEGPSGAATQRHIRARGVLLSDGYYLLVGQDAQPLDDLEERITAAFLWGTAATLVLAAIGAWLMSRVSLRRIEAIRRTTGQIMAGNLSLRIPVHGADDEFDRLSAQVNVMLDRIQSLMAGLEQVSNDIAHDLKTPLTRLRQHLELALRGPPRLAAYRAAVERAVGECDRTLATFDALLRIAQIESGTRRAGFRPLDLAEVVETIFETYEPVAEESGHRLVAHILARPPIAGDRELLVQMISNLVENGLKHTPAGCRIELALTAADGLCEIVVADDGPGIPEADRDKVFRRFYRIDTSRTTPGSGLGLALVAAVAALHEAPIAVADNSPGLKVTVTFPCSYSTPAERTLNSSRSPNSALRRRSSSSV
jgi:signal transduction histidine kinase